MRRVLSGLWAAGGTPVLQTIFIVILTGRFLFPFFYNPIDRVYSDMGRHVDNGFNLLHPNYLNGLDPKLYQVWMRLLYCFPQNQARGFDALFTGLLCASMMWFWYKALREMLNRNQALILASLLGCHLSLLLVYAFYLIETMVLTSVALAVWMMLRAIRKRTLVAFTASAACWVLAAFSKQTVIPIAMLGIVYAMSAQTQHLRAWGIVCALLVSAMIPAGLQSLEAIHMFAPFGFTDMQLISRKSGHSAYELYLADSQKGTVQSYWWKPEAFVSNPLDPIAVYDVKREDDPYKVQLDLAQGHKAWQHVIDQIENRRSWQDVAHEYEENIVYLFFAPSWPDAAVHSPDVLMQWNAWLRWAWLPMFAIVLVFGPFTRMEPPKLWIMLITLGMTWLFLLQDVTVIEGRYRKLIEPFLILSLFFLLQSWLSSPNQRQMSLKGFVMQYYVIPFKQRVLPAHKRGVL